MKPVKLIKADNVSFLEVGYVLKDFADDLLYPREPKHSKDDIDEFVRSYNADIFKVVITYQDMQTKVDVKKVKTFDEIYEEAEHGRGLASIS